MRWLVAWCVRRRGVVAISRSRSSSAGLRARQTPIDVFPEFVPAQVSIQTEAPGFTPDQVETLVTRPIEAAVNGAPGLAALRSESIPGLSAVTLDFTPGTDPQRAHQDIAERLARVAGTLPEGIGTPKLSPLTSSTMDVLKIGLVSDTLDRFALRDLAEWSLKPQLLAVPGVARVNVFGGESGSSRSRRISRSSRPTASRSRSSRTPRAPRSRCAAPASSTRGAARADRVARAGPDPAALAAAVVTVRNGVPLKIGDFATVELAAALRAGDALVQGRDGVLLTLSSQFGANTLDVTRALEAALADIVPRLAAQGVTVYPALHRPATFIERALGNLRDGLALAALFVLVVLFAFLRNVRAALISFVTIPLSLLAATLVLARIRLHAERDDARRLRRRGRRARGRRDHRHREHHAAPARERPARGPAAAPRRRARRVARDSRAGAVRDAGGRRAVRARVLHLRRAGQVHRPARARVRRGGARVARRGADRDAGARRAAAAGARPKPRGSRG